MGTSIYPSIWAPKPAKLVDIFFLQHGKGTAWDMGLRGLGVIKRPKGPGNSPQFAPVSLLGTASHTMSVTSGKTKPSLTQEILSHLGLANKVGTVIIRIIVTISTPGL